jgi:hypothetical protein
VDEFDSEEADESRNLVCPHFIACHTIWYDNTNVDAGYSLGRVIVHIRPPAGYGFPLVQFRHFLFAQLSGTPDDYVVRVRQVRIERTEGGDEQEVEVTEFGPWEINVPGENYAECFGLVLTRVPYPQAGEYEFQLWADGIDDPIGRERVQARE